MLLKRLIHTCFILFKEKLQFVLLLTRWSSWTPTVHFKCFTRNYKGWGGCVRLQMIWGEREREREEKILCAQWIWCKQINSSRPITHWAPFSKLWASLIAQQWERERERQITANRNKKKGGMKGRKEALKPFISFEFFKCVIFGENGCLKSQLEFFCFFKVRYLSTMNIGASRATVDWVYCGEALCSDESNSLYSTLCFNMNVGLVSQDCVCLGQL